MELPTPVCARILIPDLVHGLDGVRLSIDTDGGVSLDHVERYPW